MGVKNTKDYNANMTVSITERACRFCPLAVGAGEQRDLIPLGLSPRRLIRVGELKLNTSAPTAVQA